MRSELFSGLAGIGNVLLYQLSFIPTAAPSALGTAKSGKTRSFPIFSKRFLLPQRFLGCFIQIFTHLLEKSFFFFSVWRFFMDRDQEWDLYSFHSLEFLGRTGIWESLAAP